MWHPYDNLTRKWSALDHDSAANTHRDIEWDDRRWNGCASSSLPYGADHALRVLAHCKRDGYLFPAFDRFMEGLCDMRRTLDTLLPRLPYRLFAGAEWSARTCKSQRVRTSDEISTLAKSRCRQVRQGEWRSGEA
jgi:hypothetical protein